MQSLATFFWVVLKFTLYLRQTYLFHVHELIYSSTDIMRKSVCCVKLRVNVRVLDHTLSEVQSANLAVQCVL